MSTAATKNGDKASDTAHLPVSCEVQPGSKLIWDMKYRYHDDATIDGTYTRVARGVSRTENDREKWCNEFLWTLQNGGVLAGRIMSNAGIEDRVKASTINCTVAPTVYDTLSSITGVLQKAADTLQSGCVHKTSQVVTENGAVSAETAAKEKHKVILSFNIETEKFEFRYIDDWIEVRVAVEDNICIQAVDGTKLITSVVHPVLVVRDDEYLYVKAGEVLQSDLLVKHPSYLYSLTENSFDMDIVHKGHTLEKICTIKKALQYSEEFYDFTVEHNNNYLSGVGGLVVIHNCGIGYEFSTLRPKGALVRESGTKSSGPLSFMKMYDAMCETILSGGGRRGAQMATFAVHHPDIVEFITTKRKSGTFQFFNFSVLATDEFIKAVEDDAPWELYFPAHTIELSKPDDYTFLYREWPSKDGYETNDKGEVLCRLYDTISAKTLWELIMQSTYDFAEPGFILIDRMNEYNNNWFSEDIRATNPCGEQPLPPNGSCWTGNMMLSTQFGIISTDDAYALVKDGSKLLISVDEQYGGQGSKTSFRLCTLIKRKKKKEVHRYHLSGGHEIELTSDHKVSTPHGWTEIGDVEVGDPVHVRSMQNYGLELLPAYISGQLLFFLEDLTPKAGFYKIKDLDDADDVASIFDCYSIAYATTHKGYIKVSANHPAIQEVLQSSDPARMSMETRYGYSISLHTKASNKKYGGFLCSKKKRDLIAGVINTETFSYSCKKVASGKYLVTMTSTHVCEDNDVNLILDGEFALYGYLLTTNLYALSHSNRVEYNSLDHLLAFDLELRTITGCAVQIAQGPAQYTYSLQCANSDLDKVRDVLCLSTYREDCLCVPKCVFEASSISQTSFLAAVFDAACSTLQNGEVATVSKSYKWLQGIQLILLEFGVHSCIDSIGLIPIGQESWELSVATNDFYHFYRFIGVKMSRFKIKDLESLVASQQHWEDSHENIAFLEDVETIGKHDVFDIEEPTTNTLIVNGIVVHNCLLGSVNLSSFVESPFVNPSFNYEKFERVVRNMCRMLDNVVEHNGLPLQEQRKEIMDKRRHGLGFLALGTALTMMKVKYGTSAAVAFTESIAKRMAVIGYEEGLALAREKGPAPIMNQKFIVTKEMLNMRPKMVEDGFEVGQETDGKTLIFGYSNYMDRLRGVAPDLVDSLKKEGCRYTHASSIAPTGCVGPDTLILTKGGLKRITDLGDVLGGRWQDINVDVSTDEGFRTANKFFINGHSSTLKITTHRGRVNINTPDHKYRVFDIDSGYRWVESSDLLKGDVLVSLADNSPVYIKNAPLSKIVPLTDMGDKEFTQPDALTPDLARVLGYLFAKGSVIGDSAIALYRNVNSIDAEVEQVDKSIKALFSVSIDTEESLDSDDLSVSCAKIWSKNLVDWLTENKVICVDHDVKIPERILSGTRDVILAFVGGFLGPKGVYCGFNIGSSSSGHQFIRDVQVASQTVGVTFNIEKLSTSHTYILYADNYQVFSERCMPFGGNIAQEDWCNADSPDTAEEVLMSVQKEHGVLDVSTDNQDILNSFFAAYVDDISEDFIKSGGMKGISLSRSGVTGKRLAVQEALRAKTDKDNATIDEVISAFEKTIPYQIVYDVVEMVEHCGATTYDLSVPENTTYTANGLVSHNTIAIAFANNASGGIEPSFTHKYIRNLEVGKRTKESVTMYSHELWEYRKFVDSTAGDTQDSKLPDYFVGADDVLPEQHIDMQAAAQKWVDSSISKCVAKGTRIFTNIGPVKVEDIGNAVNVNHFADITGHATSVLCPDGEWRDIKSHYYGGIMPVKQVHFDNGLTISGSYVHKLRTVDGKWSMLQDLNVGDNVVCRRLKGSSSDGGRSNFDSKNTFHDVVHPNMSEDLAIFIGFFLSNGEISTKESTVTLFCNNDGTLQKSVINSVFNIEPVVVGPTPVSPLRLRMKSKLFTAWLLVLCYKDGSACIPESLMLGSRDEQRSFLSTLMAVYTAGTLSVSTVFSHKSKELVHQVFSMCTALGLMCECGASSKNSDHYSVTIFDLDSFLGFTSEWADHSFIRRPIPESVYSIENGSGGVLENWVADVKNGSIEVGSSKTFTELGISFDSDVYCLRVVKIVDEEAAVYDISVEGTHDYLIEGVASHNTINVPTDYPYEKFKGLYLYGHKMGLKGCLMTESTNMFVKTANTFVRVSTLEFDQEIKSGFDSYSKVSAIYDNGVAEVYRYTTEDGRIFDCTTNHRFITLNSQNERVEKEIDSIYVENLPLLGFDRLGSQTLVLLASREYLGLNKVMDIKIDNETETYLLNGILVHNCTTFRFNPQFNQGVLVKQSDLDNTTYTFTLSNGQKVSVKGSDTVHYEGEEHVAANLYVALNSGRF